MSMRATMGGDVGAASVPRPVSFRKKRPIDLSHLSSQTMGDRALEQEVLKLFVRQAVAARDEFSKATETERSLILHNLKGASRSVGAVELADFLGEMETRAATASDVKRLSRLIGDVCDFVAAVSR